MISFELIVYILVRIDALGANIAVWSSLGTQLNTKYTLFGRFLPITRGWTTLYLALVLWLGCALYRLDVLPL